VSTTTSTPEPGGAAGVVDRPVVAIYRDRLLMPTETYIRAQAEGMRRYRTHYVGMRRVPGLDLAADRVTVLNRGGRLGRLQEVGYKLVGVSPLLVRAVRRMRPTLIHAHLGIDGAAALPLARRLRVPFVVTFHGFDATATDEALRAGPYRWRLYLRRRAALQRHGDLFIAVSQYTRDKMLERGYPEQKTVVHYIGVDLERFRPDRAVQREPVVLFVGRLIEKKGVTHLIAAMQDVQRQLPEAELVIVGHGKLQAQLEAQAAESGVRVRFVGTLPADEVRGWMNRARVLCVPSVTAANGDSEGLPLVVLEAMAMGLPIVGSTSAGIPEAVTHGCQGLLGGEGDRAALADNLRVVLSDPDAWQRMSDGAIDRVRETFDLRRQNARLEELYDAARRAV
jgi:colanic acid/amylovoran biosynthesis glycosyltransferase